MAQRLRAPIQQAAPRAAPAAVLGGLIFVAGLGLGGCVSLPANPFAQPPVDMTSPIAADIKKANPPGAPYPTFAQIPDVPQDVRPATAWTRNIYDTLRLRRQMQALAVLYPQTLTDTDAFAEANKKKAVAPVPPAEPAAETAKANKFAKDQRERAKAPSPVN